MNTLSRQYKVDYDSTTDSYAESLNGSMPVVEFVSTDGITQRAITVNNINDLKNKVFKNVVERQLMVDGNWITDKLRDTPTATITTYVNALDGKRVDPKDAFDEVEDTDNEFLDMTDPLNPIRFDPPQYGTKKVLKTGVVPEADAILSQFAPVLFPFFTNSMSNRFEIVDPT